MLAGRALDVGGVEGEGLEAALGGEAGAQDPGEAGDVVGVLEQEVAEGVGDGAAAVAFDALEDVRVVADDEVGAEVERVIALGARRVDIGQGEQSWVVLADPEGNEFCILAAE